MLTPMYGETLCSVSAGYDSCDKLFGDLGHSAGAVEEQ